MRDIIKDALYSLKDKWIAFYLIPLLLSISLGLYTLKVNPDFIITDDIIGPIGIFSALMFSVIFIVVEHFLKRKSERTSNKDEDVRYIENYREFAKNVVAMIAFSIFLAGWIILLSLVLPKISFEVMWFVPIKNAIYSFFLLQYVALIIIVVKEMYAMLTDDIESK